MHRLQLGLLSLADTQLLLQSVSFDSVLLLGLPQHLLQFLLGILGQLVGRSKLLSQGRSEAPVDGHQESDLLLGYHKVLFREFVGFLCVEGVDVLESVLQMCVEFVVALLLELHLELREDLAEHLLSDLPAHFQVLLQLLLFAGLHLVPCLFLRVQKNLCLKISEMLFGQYMQ